MQRPIFATLALTAVGLALTVTVASGQPAPAAPATAKPEVGIPIDSPVVQKACGSCHTTDDKKQMSRLSFQRNTPEGWQDTLKRMVALNGLQIEPQTAREVVKYLSNNHGLAPEEAKPAAFEVERRIIDYTYTASSDVEGLCNRCHSLGRVISQRRTKGEWDGVIAMHRGWYPLVDRQAFRRMGPVPRDRSADGRPADTRHPVEKAVDHLSKAFPLQTAEWSAWSGTMRPARIDGTWTVSGWDPGKGAIYGRVVITPVAGSTDEFTTAISYTYARSGRTVARAGKVMVYTGFQWRGRSTEGADDASALREVMFVERDWRRIEGRWFTGGYDEQGLDVRFERAGGPQVLGFSKTALRAGSTGNAVKLFGANLPTSPQAADFDLGPGLTVASVGAATADGVTLTVDVAQSATTGPRGVVFAGVASPAALTVFDQVDFVRITPSWNMARIGGITVPKMFAQFEAWAMHNGLDGKPDTADDLKLDMVDARWSLEEYTATFDDDDIKYVGTIEETTGRFLPNIEGPNPKRKGERNNIGDVWVVATYIQEGMSAPPKPALRARSHLLVTVPLYNRWDPSVIP